MNRRVVAILGALVTAGAAKAPLDGQAPAQAPAQAPLIVAYMTSDGELVPIARYDGTHWRNTWPEPIPDDAPLPVRGVSEIPRGWLGQPVPLKWIAWSQSTRKQQRVTVTGVDRDGSCFEAITLATSFKPDPPSEGLAFDRPTTIDAIIESGVTRPVDQSSPEFELLRRELAAHFSTAISKATLPRPGNEHDEMGAEMLALSRADKLTDKTVVVQAVFRDPRFPVHFIEAERQLSGIPAGTGYDLSYGGWFRRDSAAALTPISASVVVISSGEGKSPRYTPIGILRLGVRSIWVMSEWGKESQTIVLFDVSARGVRKLTSADVSGC
jgi:hypothetical protein